MREHSKEKEMKKNYLLAPGPTPVPERALLAMAQPMIHHRTPQFSAIFKEAATLLKDVFRTKEDVLILASSLALETRLSL